MRRVPTTVVCVVLCTGCPTNDDTSAGDTNPGASASTSSGGGDSSSTDLAPGGSSSTSAATDASETDDTSSTGGASSGAETTASGVPDCPDGSRDGTAGETWHATTPAGRTINVRVPQSYDPSFAAPLTVLYAYSGATAEAAESFMTLTEAANEAGHIVAYADHGLPSEVADIADLASVAAIVSERYCVDQERITVGGHSDGASVASYISLSPGAVPAPTALVASAGGLDNISFQGIRCPPPRPVMVIHGTNDTVFPNRGAEAAQWWASCNGCSSEEAAFGETCSIRTDCSSGAAVVFCEGPWTHFEWPPVTQAIFDFLAQEHGQ